MLAIVIIIFKSDIMYRTFLPDSGKSGWLFTPVMVSLNAQGTGYSVGLIFFAFSLLILGYLIIKYGYFPKILGILMFFAAAGYLVDSSAYVLLPNYDAYAEVLKMIVLMPAFIGELAMTL